MNSRADEQPSSKQSDLLLWLGGALVIGVGATWFLLSKPWSSPPASVTSIETTRAAALASAAPRQNVSALTGGDSSLDNPLRMAQLAYDAGMLLEPEDYSAWTLYVSVLQSEPGHSAAMDGLIKVADELVPRGSVALEQGRYDDARRIAERILAVLPGHEGALDLAKSSPRRAAEPPAPAERVVERAQRPTPTATVDPVLPRPDPASTRVTVAPQIEEEPPRSDPFADAHGAFRAAMTTNRLLAPAGNSARDHVATLIALDPEHELTLDARRRLFDALITRAAQAVETLDTGAANTWIAEAERLQVDSAAVAAMRRLLVDRLVARESGRPVPAAELAITSYVAPQYPQRALDRSIEGWVDVEFVVGSDGSTRDVTVAAASHENFFRNEAVRAVEQWHFEPRVFMGQPIEQRSHTRIRFAFGN